MKTSLAGENLKNIFTNKIFRGLRKIFVVTLDNILYNFGEIKL